MKKILSGFRFTDQDTEKAMKEIHEISGYVADPHGAVGYLGLKEYFLNQKENLILI